MAGHVETMEGVRLTKRADALRGEGRRRRGRPRLGWEDCAKKDLAGVGGKWTGGVETGGGDGSETGLVVKKMLNKSSTGIGANLTPHYRNKE